MDTTSRRTPRTAILAPAALLPPPALVAALTTPATNTDNWPQGTVRPCTC